MRIYPEATKRSITMRDSYESPMNENPLKKLRKLPHVFSKVLELPFTADADVSVEDTQDIIRFIAKIEIQGEHDDVADGIRAQVVEIHPGVTKIVVRNGGGDSEILLDHLEVDTWRFRLPRAAQPELATAVFVDEKLIVTVPKDGERDMEDDVWRGRGQLVFVQ